MGGMAAESSCLSFFGFAQEITLGPYDRKKHETDKRAISQSISADVDIQSIRIYNNELRSEKFLTDIHECCICFSKFPGNGFARLPCPHFFCLTCMKTYADMHVKEGTVLNILCPEAKCGSMFPPGLLRRLLSNEDYERWESLMLQKTLESMSDTSYCPRCETICIEDEDNSGRCSKCFFSFCTLCRERWHPVSSCSTGERKFLSLVLKEWQKPSLTGLGLAYAFNEVLSLGEMNVSTRRCPSCKIAITRISGCNLMRCSNCMCQFCYNCSQPMEHHSSKQCVSTPKVQRLALDGVNIDQFLRQIEVNPGLIHGCPSCHQLNVKLGSNNRITCSACQTPYCYLCWKRVVKASNHFGPNHCLQHT